MHPQVWNSEPCSFVTDHHAHMAGAPGGSGDKSRPKAFSTMSQRRAAAAARAEAASRPVPLADPPLRMELQHAAKYLPAGTVPQIEKQLSVAFSRILPAFDAAVERSEGENGEEFKGLKMWSLLGIDTDFMVDGAGGIAPLVLEANVCDVYFNNLIIWSCVSTM